MGRTSCGFRGCIDTILKMKLVIGLWKVLLFKIGRGGEGVWKMKVKKIKRGLVEQGGDACEMMLMMKIVIDR